MYEEELKAEICLATVEYNPLRKSFSDKICISENFIVVVFHLLRELLEKQFFNYNFS